MALSYTALITASEVETAAMSNFSEVDFTGSDQDHVEDIIEDVTDSIEQYLDRRVIVRKYKDQPVPAWRWNYDEIREDYVHMPPNRPIVQVETDGVSVGTDEHGEDVYLLSGNTQEEEVTFYAGYKRGGQTLSDLQSAIDDTLDTTPDDIPGAIRRAALKLVLYEIDLELQAMHAKSSRDVNNAGSLITLNQPRTDVYEQELDKIAQYRNLI